ncbi:MAG: hypothetical protein ACI4DU_09705, partial [Lachnospiraceae bacterium]
NKSFLENKPIRSQVNNQIVRNPHRKIKLPVQCFLCHGVYNVFQQLRESRSKNKNEADKQNNKT